MALREYKDAGRPVRLKLVKSSAYNSKPGLFSDSIHNFFKVGTASDPYAVNTADQMLHLMSHHFIYNKSYREYEIQESKVIFSLGRLRLGAFNHARNAKCCKQASHYPECRCVKVSRHIIYNISMENLSGPELVKAVRLENPSMSIEDVLDKVRTILVKKNIEIVKSLGHDNIFMNIKELLKMNMAHEDLVLALEEFGGIDSGLLDQFINMTEAEVPVLPAPRSCCLSWRTAGKGKTRGTGPQP